MNRTKYLHRLGVDILIIAICLFVAEKIAPFSDSLFSKRHIIFMTYIMAFWYFASQVTSLYHEFLTRSLSQEIISVTKTIFLQDAFIIIALFFVSRNPLEAKWFVCCFMSAQFILLPLSKYLSRWYYASTLNKGKRAIPLLVVGAGRMGMSFNSIIDNNYQFGFRIAGFVDDEPKPYLNGQYLGKIAELDRILQENEVNDVIIALPNAATEKIKYAIKVSEEHGKRVRLIPDYLSFSSSVTVASFGTLPLVSLRKIPLDDSELRFFKRTFDIIFSILFFVLVASWLFTIIAILIKLNSKGPVFFIQERWGINNKKIFCYKFRSMVSSSKDVDEHGVYQQAQKNDARITSIGRFLRKTSLDELPQFINVLKGEMSIVGPRPHPTPLNLHSKNIVNNYLLRHLVKPGITGWAQVNGQRGETKDAETMQKRIDFDIWYIENWSFWLDCQIIIQTVINMIKGEENAY